MIDDYPTVCKIDVELTASHLSNIIVQFAEETFEIRKVHAGIIV